MRKILMGVLVILLIVMAYFTIFKGISLGSFQILSVNQIKEENDKLTQEISQTETLMHSSYPTKTDELDKSVSTMLTAKDEYLDLASVSTEGELSKANKEESYKIEYLWTRIGSHATSEGVTLKFDVISGDSGGADSKNLSFSVSGSYIAIINFVSALEDDSQLGFRIENFKILPGSDQNGRQATFVVRNIKVKLETTSASTPAPTSGDAVTNNNNPENTNTNTTTETTDGTNQTVGQ